NADDDRHDIFHSRWRPVAMERMPYRDDIAVQLRSSSDSSGTVSTDWRGGLPVLASDGVVLRELRASDASALHALLSNEEVARFISPPPSTVEGFERFIAATRVRQACHAEVLLLSSIAGCCLEDGSPSVPRCSCSDTKRTSLKKPV